MKVQILVRRLLLLAMSLALLAAPITALAAPSIQGFTVETWAEINHSRMVSTDPAGNVYGMGQWDGIVHKTTPAGVQSVVVDITAPFGNRYVGPYFEPVSGDLFVADCVDGTILKISSGNVSTFVPHDPSVNNGNGGLPICRAGFTSDASGNLYASDWIGGDHKGRVIKITPSGTVSNYATGLNAPDGIDFGPGGEMYVANRWDHQVMVVPAGGGVATVFASGGGMNVPLDVVADSAGNVFVANFVGGTISKISPAGVVSTFGTGFSLPMGLAFDPSGNLFISDHGNDNGVLGEGGGFIRPRLLPSPIWSQTAISKRGI